MFVPKKQYPSPPVVTGGGDNNEVHSSKGKLYSLNKIRYFFLKIELVLYVRNVWFCWNQTNNSSTAVHLHHFATDHTTLYIVRNIQTLTEVKCEASSDSCDLLSLTSLKIRQFLSHPMILLL